MSKLDEGIGYLIEEWEKVYNIDLDDEARAALSGLICGLTIAAANSKVAEVIKEQTDARLRKLM